MALNFREACSNKSFVVTAELGPPKGTNVTQFADLVGKLREAVDAINVTDNQSAVMKLSPLAACRLILEVGGEPILQLTCRDRNRLALQSDLLAAWVLGIRNVLCLTGDHVRIGDHPSAKPVFDLDSVQLLQLVEKLNAGQDLVGNALDGATNFFAGAAVTPGADPLEPQLLKFRKKIAAGAKFFQTQAVFDIEELKRFLDRAQPNGVTVLAGIVLLVSPRMAQFLNENIPGVFVPERLIDRLASVPKEKRLDEGVRIAAELIRAIRDHRLCQGVHIMAIGREEKVLEILRAAQ
jgi:methylenetetrahydrofolate reductase (NADPH)